MLGLIWTHRHAHSLSVFVLRSRVSKPVAGSTIVSIVPECSNAGEMYICMYLSYIYIYIHIHIQAYIHMCREIQHKYIHRFRPALA